MRSRHASASLRPDEAYGRREPATFAPLRWMHDLRAIPFSALTTRTWRSLIDDRIFGHAAELGFYFLFALFPTLFCASSLLGLIARSVARFYDRLLEYLSLVIPTAALGTVLTTFNETAAAATSGKVTFGTIAALWSASVGISAIQDTLNAVHKIEDSRSYLAARLYAIGLTILLTVICSTALACMFAGDFVATAARCQIANHITAVALSVIVRVVAWAIATALLTLAFATVYYWAPDWKERRWHWLTPGSVLGIAGWLVASLGFRAYLHFFNSYTLTYGSLGAVIILLMWFYISGLMLLVGAEINSTIDEYVVAPGSRPTKPGDPSSDSLPLGTPPGTSPT